MSKIVVVIPSYNSRAGIIQVVSGVLEAVAEASIIVVDDNSPDKAAELVKRKFGRDKRVRVVVRKRKGGRGSAVIRGFKEGLKDKSVEYFVEMDADFSHDPSELPKLLAKLRKHDVVVGSRYLPGAKIIGWGARRRIFSRLANLWARLVLGIPISDYTNGYRCYRRKVVEAIDFEKVKSRGFAVLSEMAFQIHEKGFSFAEIPTVFTYRPSFGSNFNMEEVREALWTVLSLRLGDS